MSSSQIIPLLVNLALMVVVAAVGWLIRRAISANDIRIDTLGTKLEATTTAINRLELLIVGDYYPRKEHLIYADNVNKLLEQIRGNIHELRAVLQTLQNRISIVEVIQREHHQQEKPQS